MNVMRVVGFSEYSFRGGLREMAKLRRESSLKDKHRGSNTSPEVPIATLPVVPIS